jgi:tetratricopeptide (TPR) repeat protein
VIPPGGRQWLGYCVLAGAILGYGFIQLREIKDWRWRVGLSAVVAAGMVYLATLYLDDAGWIGSPASERIFGLFILAGLPFFWLLTFCGIAEESEIEISALCAGLGIGIHLIRFPSNMPALGFLFPVLLYFVYTTRWLSGMRVFKHSLRGYGYLNVGRIKDALLSFNRARTIDPRNPLASKGLLEVHTKVDVRMFERDPELLDLLNYHFCLDRAQNLLIGEQSPTEAQRTEADRMIDLVERKNPRLQPRTDYLRAISFTHAKRFDEAADYLGRLLDPGQDHDAKVRNAVLYSAWDLALRLHPEIVSRIGTAELDRPGRRMDAIAAVERHLAADPEDPTAVEHKRMLYASLTEPEYLAAAQEAVPSAFNYDYVEQLGLDLINDPSRRDRGMAYLRIAARGLPAKGPAIFQTLAAIAESQGDRESARGYREQIKRCGLEQGAKNLPPDQRDIYFRTLSELIADAEKRGDFEAAAADQRLMLESGRNELDAYRKLADLYEKAADPLNALLATETALLYSGKDADLLARKDKYYYSTPVERLTVVKDKVANLFDVNYCIVKANGILNQREADLDLIDWASHLIALARVIQPDNLSAKLADGRLRMRRGERDAGLALLEDVREAKASGGEEKEAWFTATRILGDLYLNELNRPDLALACFSDYKEHPKSGADTLFRIAQCYEAKNDVKNALKFYDAVTAYESHPKYWDATEAVRRLKG